MKMAPDSVKSEQLNLKGVAWKNLMNDCLMQVDIFEETESKNECSVNFDPNIVMNIRHKMIKGSVKTFATPRGQIYSEAFKILREEYHDRLLRHKEEKLVEKEIVKLRQMLESHRLVIKKKLEEISEKTKASPDRTKLTKWDKGPEHCQTVRRMGGWLASSAQMSVESKIKNPNPMEIPGKRVKVPVKSQQQEAEEVPELKYSRKGSPIEDDEREGEKEKEFWEEDGGKGEIMRRFLENDMKSLRRRSGNEIKEGGNVKRAAEVRGTINERNLGRVLRKWRNRGEYKNKKTENKIEGFLSRLREKKVTAIRVGSETRRQMWEKRAKDDETDEKLRKLMQDVKSSQKESREKLQETRNRIEIESKILLRMEERRKDRLKRRSEFEERKLKLEEERKKAERQREEERKQKDEEEKRKRLEELKEKRKAEKEKREEHVREREKLKVAIAHHKVYLVRGYGLRPWMRLMRMRDEQEEKAKRFFERRLKEGTLRKWLAEVKEQAELKVGRAVEFYEGKLKNKYLVMWMEFRDRNVRQNQVAVDWYDLKVSETAFKRWLQFTKAEQWEWRIKSELAADHYHRKLKMRFMEKLREYPALKRLELAKENRKWKWRQKVKEILPDYEPVSISDNL